MVNTLKRFIFFFHLGLLTVDLGCQGAPPRSGLATRSHNPDELAVEGAVNAPSLAALKAQRALLNEPGVELRLDQSGLPRTVIWSRRVVEHDPVQRVAEALQPLQDVLFIENEQDWSISQQRIRTVPGGEIAHIRVQPMHAGIPFDQERVDLHFATQGTQTRLIRSTGSFVPSNLIDKEAAVELSQGMALQKARIQLGRSELDWQLQAKLVFRRSLQAQPGATLSYVPAWRIDAKAKRLPFAETLWFKADASGNLIERINTMKQGRLEALLYPVNPSASARQWLGLPHLSLFSPSGDLLGTTNALGEHEVAGTISLPNLRGPYANVRSELDTHFQYSGAADGRIELMPLDPNLSELSAFYFTNRAHDWFKERFSFVGLDHPIDVTVHAEDCLFNAYAWGDENMAFGNGCGVYDFAQTADVVFHEYGHLVVHNIADLDYSAWIEAGALNEGLADYFSCSMTNDPRHGENLTGVFTRRCDSNARYDRDYNGEAHNGAEITSGIVWKLRQAFGSDIADRLAFLSLYYLPKHPYFLDFKDALLAADTEAFGGEHAQAINNAFVAHGLSDQPTVFVASSSWKPEIAPFTVNLTAHAQGFDRHTLRFDWQFGDGRTAEGESLEHQFTQKPFTARVTARDASGQSRFHEIELTGCSAAKTSDALVWLAVGTCLTLVRRKKHQA